MKVLVTGGAGHGIAVDYPTPDGTCIRGYVHVADIADLDWAPRRPELEEMVDDAWNFVQRRQR